MKILFTGASSFTGFWFAKALSAAGHQVVCPITKNIDDYLGLRQRRVDLLKPLCRMVSNTPFGSATFLTLVSGENFDLLCHHAAEVKNYKSPDFDTSAAVRQNTLNLPIVLSVMRKRGLKSVVLTGTYFEEGEGISDECLRHFSPYSRSKTLTYELFQNHCNALKMPLGKFVISNPFGPLEEPRFTAFLMKNWKVGLAAEVRTPDYLRDNVHVGLLAAAYVTFVTKAMTTEVALFKVNPCGYIEKQGEFAKRVACEVRVRTGWPCELYLMKQKNFDEPLSRANTDPIVNSRSDWSEGKAWDDFVRFYTGELF